MGWRKETERQRKYAEQQSAYAAEQRRKRIAEQQIRDAKAAQRLQEVKRPEKPRSPMEALRKSQYASAIEFANSRPIRNPNDWRPVGKSIDALYFSFITHTMVKHAMPKHLYLCLTWKSRSCYPRDFFVRAATGESVFKVMKEAFTIPITRKWAHLLMTATHSETHPIKAIRLAQVMAHGGNRKMYNHLPIAKAVMADLMPQGWTNTANYYSPHDFGSIEQEIFTDEIINWFCRQTNAVEMFDYNQVEPILDFFAAAKRDNVNYTVSGRTLASVMKAMEDWHKFLNKGQGDNSAYKSCGIPDWSREVKYEREGHEVTGTWIIEEILTSKRLSKEGREMRHCVASYSGSIKSGLCSIFAMMFKGEDWVEKARATIRLDRRTKNIIEARGHCNARLAPNQITTLRRWAQENNLNVTTAWL